MSERRYPYVHVDVAPEEADEASSLLFDLGAEGVEERDDGTLAPGAAPGRVTLVASFPTREDAESAIAELSASYPSRYEEVIGDEWRDAWKQYFRPFAIADGVVVRPPWEPYEAKPGERVLELEPGRAFGTGLHETTRLVAQALGRYATELADRTILDVGCGSGILTLVALVFGAKDGVAIDVDPEAIEVTAENAARNGLADRVATSTTPVERAPGAPVVVANIEARVLVPMAPELAKRVEPGGLLFLSGILVTQQDDVRRAYPAMDLLEAPTMGEWALLVMRNTEKR